MRRSSSSSTLKPLGAFLLIACFGILFAGCNPGAEPVDEFVISEDEASRFREMAMQAEQEFLSGTIIRVDTQSGGLQPVRGTASGSVKSAPGSTVDLSQVATYKALRASATGVQGDVYMVTNSYLNLRAKPDQKSAFVSRLNQGETMQVSEFTDAAWAKVKTSSGLDGYVSTQFIAKLTTDDKIGAERQKFAGMYFVNFGFLNVRAQPDQKSEKLGEIPGQAIVKPISIDGQWAKVTFQGKEGFVSSAYLAPFTPDFVTRQESYRMPVLVYRLGQPGLMEVMEQHLARLKRDGMVFQTASSFRDVLLRQQRDSNVRLPDNSILVAITGVTPDNVRLASDALGRAGVRATFFIETRQLGLTGITEKQLLTVLANGNDVQSAAHAGDDLRALTNAQVDLEMKQSRQLLEEATSRDVFAVAYPQGGVNDRVMGIAADAGYLFGIGSGGDKTFSRSQLLAMPSQQIFPTMTPDEISTMTKGP